MVSSERVILRVTYLLVGNKRALRVVDSHVNWVFWLIVAWLAISVTVAVVFSRVIRVRDKREMLPPLDGQPSHDGTCRTWKVRPIHVR
ncbi:hypothetical protein [Rhodococcus sp. HM1]|uniref:hypothetical protein n=1 Tax=Rhodococcus sp. HM1 TaxID=2937759 RepID=UPI0024A67D0D|nr:hypothetical protein [Rhodococcus sp. HM1]